MSIGDKMLNYRLKRKGQDANVILTLMKKHFPDFIQVWKDYENRNITKKELITKWDKLCDECCLKNGVNNVKYVKLNVNTIQRLDTTKKDIVWTDGALYDFIFIRLPRANKDHLITFMNTLYSSIEIKK